MTTGLPVSRVVNVQVNLSAIAAQAQNFNSLVIVGSSDVIDVVERMRSYGSIADVATDFGTSAPEYLAANLWFEQTPQPVQLFIARWAKTASHGKLLCAPLSAAQQLMSAWTAITNGGFKISVDGNALYNVTGLNFSAQTNLNGVASIIQTALASQGSPTVVWNAEYDRFEFESNTTGAASSISFLVAPTSGTDISGQLGGLVTSSGAYVANGIVAETALSCVAGLDDQFGNQWYALTMIGAADADHLAIAPYIEASSNKHFYGVSTQEAGVIVAATTSDIAYQLQLGQFKHTAVQYSSSNPYAIISALARILTTNWNANKSTITLKFKQEPGIVPETLNTSQANAAEAKDANIYVNYNNNTAIFEQGVCCSGDFVDTIIGCDWLAVQIQTNVYNLLYGALKVPQTDPGMQLISTAIAQACEAGVFNGLVAPGTWNTGGFGQLSQGDPLPTGYYIYVPPISSQNQADREARESVPFQVAVKLAGAVHSADVIVNVNR